MSAWAKVGAKCVCVDAVWPVGTWYGKETLPKLNQPYTIRAVRQHVSGEWGILLEEVVNPQLDYADGVREAFWAIRRFRPLITRTQSEDVALIKSLLVTEGADA